jgi:peptide chain release factor 3
VDGRRAGALFAGQVRGVFADRPHGVAVSGAGCCGGADPDLVEGLHRPHHEMKRIEAAHGLRGAIGDDGVDPVGAITADMGQRRGPAGAQFIEEAGLGVFGVDDEFSAFVFKVQAGVDSAHRDRLAYARVCSGVFRRGDIVTHASTGRPFATKYAQSVFGQQRATIDTAWPGDVIGLVNATALRVGDTLYCGDHVEYPAVPQFTPEHFAVARAADPSKHKAFRRGIIQLGQEGVIQVLRSDLRGDQAPVLAAVGPMQFEVTSHRMAGELRTPITVEHLNYTVVRRTRAQDVGFLNSQPGVEVLTRTDGALLALFSDKWRVEMIQRNRPALVLEPLAAAGD